MTDHPQDLPTLTDDERRARVATERADGAPIVLTGDHALAVAHALEELDAFRQAARDAHTSPTAHLAAARPTRPFPALRAWAASLPQPDEAGDVEPTWQEAADAVAGRIRVLAVDLGSDGPWDDDDASALRHLAAVLPMLEARAGARPSEVALADVVAEGRAVVATIARNGIDADHLTGRLEPLGDAIRDLDRALDALPPR